MSSQNALRSGFVCMLGPTNAGKSTLMNAVIGQKLAIITPKPQTTRNRILGIHTVPGRGQLVFVDTPGLHKPRGRLGQRMVDIAVRSLEETDVALLVVDVTRDLSASPGQLHPANDAAAARVVGSGLPAVAALNKVDRVRDKGRLLPILDAYQALLPDAEVIPISALHHDGLDRLENALFDCLPESPLLYPEDMLSDQVERFMAAEVIREKLMLETRQELPYSCAVEVESWQEPEDKEKALRIAAVIHVERDSQKGIVIGKGGQRIKKIGTLARVELEQLFATKVFLETFVRVDKDWTNNPRRLRQLGY